MECTHAEPRAYCKKNDGCSVCQPSTASVGYPPDVAETARLLDDLARWFDSPKESRRIIMPFTAKDDSASLLRAMAAELRRKNEIRG